MGWKYFEFGKGNTPLKLMLKIRGCGCKGRIRVFADSPDGEEIGSGEFGTSDGIISVELKPISGRKAIYLKAEAGYEGWAADMFKERQLFELMSFVFAG